jgi:hypothetical protein
MPKLTVDYKRVLELMPPGMTWADLSEAMKRPRIEGSKLITRISNGIQVRDYTASRIAKALTELSGETVELDDILANPAPASAKE